MLDKAPGAVLQGGGHPGNAEIRFYQAAWRYAVEYFVRGRDLMGSIPGDIVLAKQTAEADERFSAEAVVVSVLEANNGLQTGVIVAEGNKLMVLPDKLCNDPLVIAKVSKAALCMSAIR